MPDVELLDHYSRDHSRRGPEPPGALSGAAGGSACGDLVRISLGIEDGLVRAVSFEAEGCAALLACAAALAEEIEGAPLLSVAAVGAGRVAELVGGLEPHARHAAELVADGLGRALGAWAGSGEALLVAPEHGERVLVALSGGVDSALAALLERERGAEVVTVTLKLWADERTDGSAACCSPEAVRGARALAHSLGIAHLTLDLEPEFRRQVVDFFLDGHRAGITPNPCVRCNGSLRIDAMVELADRIGARRLSTGHYARVTDDGEGPLLTAAADPAKDQGYMLSGLRPETLARMRFPLAGLTKPQVRARAAAAGLAVAGKAESQDLCFLAGEGKRSFLSRHAGLEPRAGEIVDREGAVLGEHSGHQQFTVGQRRGLGLAGTAPSFVLATDPERNRVVVGPRELLATTRVKLRAARLLRDSHRADHVRLRYHGRSLACRLSEAAAGEHPELELELAEPAYGVAPGQTACLLEGERIVGTATIA